jgi:hypothetical protein
MTTTKENLDTQLDRGDWFETFTGRQFYPLHPSADDVCIEDIAHALSQLCRFGGHCIEPYSIAQHSVLVSRLCKEQPLQGLLHDATEAFGINDCVRPAKRYLPDYKKMEHGIWLCVAEKFGLPAAMHPEVHHADNVTLMTERRDVCNATPYKWGLEDQFRPLDDQIVVWNSKEAEANFLAEFYKLQKQIK